MLLLVLILVLVAFGLLLVGFLSSSVLWAWVSVAVSVAAALVLLFDTLQRRSVVKAGDESGGADTPGGEDGRPDPSTLDGPTRATRYPDIEPVTEVIPIIRSSAYGPPQVSYGSSGAPMRSGGPVGRGVDPRFDPDADSQQTVMMPAVGPSGSPVGPSGATPDNTPSSESSSPSVTAVGADRSSSTTEAAGSGAAPVDDEAADGTRGANGGEATVVAAAVGSGSATRSASTDPTADDTPADDSAADDSSSGVASGSSPAGSSPASARAPADPAGTESVPPDMSSRTMAGSGVGAPDGGPAFGTGSGGPDGPAVGATESAGPPPAEQGLPGGEPGAGGPDAGWGQQARGAEIPGEGEMPDGSPDSPPEERAAPAAAALVAGLEDEVLVIDEQPRYHVPGCRTLLAAPLIPLPAREAVELGFTPCGWCTPDRTLAGRHPAAAR